MKYSAVCFLFLCSNLIICSTSSFIESRVLEVDPDANRNVTEIIISRGYPVEEYTVQTKDGYLLKLFRIPYGRKSQVQNTKNRPVVFLQHGLLGSATDWVINFPDQSLSYIFADEGYDVWMGNQRGNTYARKHIKYSTEEDKFWDFSIDEHAKYDTPDSIDFVLNKTGQSQLYYVGFSQGNMIVYAFLSENPEYNKIKAVLSLGPTAWLGHIKSLPLRLLAPFTSEAQFLYSVLGHKEFLPNDFITKLFAQTACNVDVVRSICSNIYFQISGYDFSQLNESRLDVYFSHFPAGTSTKNIIHLGQLVNSKEFQKYYYGLLENLKKYKQVQPPKYDVRKIKTPIGLFWSLNDLLANTEDVDILRKNLPNLIVDYQVPLEEWGHLDFMFAKETKKYVYDELLRELKSI
ncbi:gastric triacylglycerol lipase-like [Centruroides sculpturatus]|uniref:gastric triacylglycerol lipase-like n=1 Tax=Centruroides sculpturatus TaxID=218467 RepID=UPI000C6DCC0C|nr:gastric triacylglycerol lipase-like [Centruroides sculpturatus]